MLATENAIQLGTKNVKKHVLTTHEQMLVTNECIRVQNDAMIFEPLR